MQSLVLLSALYRSRQNFAVSHRTVTFPRVSRRERHFANVGEVIIYPDLVVARTDEMNSRIGKFSQGLVKFPYLKEKHIN